MLTPNLPEVDTLILDQLDIPGKTGPVSESPKVWGINIAAALGNFPRQGLLCRAGPWTSMGIGDQIKVFWNKDVEVLQKTVGPADVNTTLQMFVPSARIPEGRAVGYYSVKRLGQTWETSEDLQVLVKLTRPGGHDDNNDPGHSKLIMHLPQDILDGGIDKDNVAAGVPVAIESYPDIAAGDVIQVSWGGVFVLSAPLTQDQADGKVPLVVHVSEAVIREAGDSDGVGLSVAFEVYDKVDNRSEDWSAAQRVVVAIDASRLEAPILKEAQSNVLDIDQLGDAPGTAQVWVTTGGSFQPGDTPIIRVKGTPVEGLPIDVEFTGEPLTSVPTTAEIPIANAVLRQMAKSQIALSYRLKKASGAPDMPSKSQFISAIGAIKRLAAPKALDAVNGALDPTLKQVRIEIQFDASFADGQAIKLFWLGTRPELTPYLPELPLYPLTAGDISAGKPLLIPIDGAHLTPINGGKLELYYQLLIEDAALGAMNHVNATHAIRESIHADILQVGEPRLELPEPVVAGVIDGALPGDTAGTTLTVNYLNTVKNDEVIYEWIGSKTGTKTDGITLSSLTEGKPVPFRIDAEFISGNNGGTVLAKYLIKRAAGGTSYSNALEFRVGAELVAPVITSVKDPYGKEVPNDTTVTNDSVTLTGTATAGLEVEIFDGATLKGTATVNASGVWTRGIGGLAVGPHSLTVKGVYGSNPVSAARTFTVANALVPAITSVKDSKGIDIPQNGTTVDTTVTLTGTGTANRAVDIYDGTTLKDSAPINAQGIWTYTAASLSIAAHAFKAKAKYGSETESPIRSFTVTAMVTPTITSIKDSKGVEIPPGGTTIDTSVTITGTASKGQKVDVRDGSASKGKPPVDPTTGVWTLKVSGLSVSEHSITAKAMYGTESQSSARIFTVAHAVLLENFDELQAQNYQSGQTLELRHIRITPLFSPPDQHHASMIEIINRSPAMKGMAYYMQTRSTPSLESAECVVDIKVPCSKISFWLCRASTDKSDRIHITYTYGNGSKKQETLTISPTPTKIEFSESRINRVTFKSVTIDIYARLEFVLDSIELTR